MHGSSVISEHCYKQSPVPLGDGVIRCCTLTADEDLSVLTYTRPIEHEGEGWLLVNIRFEYRTLLSRLSGRRR